MKPKVFLTRELPPKAMEYLQAHTELEKNHEDRVLTKQEIMAGVKGKDALLCLLTDQIDAEIMDVNPDLKVISNYAVGFNNIDIKVATQRKIVVTNTPGVLTETTADMAFGLLITLSRRIAEGDQFVRTKRWEGWAPLQMLGMDVYGATLGLVGLGSIGKAMIKRAQGFHMKVIYWNRTRLSAKAEQELHITYAPLEDVLAEADFISLHVAYNKETHHLIDKQELALMKASAYLINTARGPIINEKALVQALKNNQIAGAGMDVFEQEPQLEPELYELKNTVLAPHLGSATIDTRTKMGMMAAENLLAVFEDRLPANLVNKEVLDGIGTWRK
ncbi:2-hydroxyacid dehydrogenase [Gracilibacillus phocaeensis]|uniref:2-hydroxyacid dehydrogenase n=1 Tax=Gracilibacillus phocaeensis TaxID=2042304 RepID=UPI00102F419F|nr:D-glycerate dehydrogenase [Gracilibacillus phocaeensis]